MISAAAATGLPILLSTGLSSLEEIAHAVETVEATGNKNLVILHCLAMYPPPDSAVNLLNMDMLRDAFSYPVGFSDHTMGTEIGIACMARGAVAYEKHFTLDKELEGWDHATSADPEDMKLLNSAATRVHAAMGSPVRRLTEGEINMRKAFRRSIVTARDISAGDMFQMEDLDYKRPGVGLAPNTNASLIGRKAAHDIAKDTLISYADLEGGSDQ
jgi:N,N'-diacetyllegionaminate synthase